MNIAIQLQPQSLRPALRLVKTNTLSRDEWLEVRKHGIGSSDAVAAMSLNPYKSQLELWMKKTGRDADLSKPDPTDTTAPVYWGTLLEPSVAASYTQQTVRRVRKANAVLQHPDRPWMLASIDREVTGASDIQILERKTAGSSVLAIGVTVFPSTFSCKSSTNWPSPANKPQTSPSCYVVSSSKCIVSNEMMS